MKGLHLFIVLSVFSLALIDLGCRAQQIPAQTSQAQLVILDTDIGDDIDDAYALALVLRSPELVQIVGP